MAGEISKIAIIGAGLVGRSSATVFARAGCAVALYDGRAGISASALDRTACSAIADCARRLGPLDQSIAASTVAREVWDKRLIAKVEAQGRHKRNMQDAPS